MKRNWRAWLVPVATVATLGSGLVNIFSVSSRDLPERHRLLREFFPLEFLNISRFATLLIGIALVVSSLNIYKRKKRAFQVACGLAIASAIFNLAKGLDFEETSLSLALLGVFFLARSRFTVRSSVPDWQAMVSRLALVFAVSAGYGIVGFWFLDPREFGIDFSFHHSIQQTWKYLTFSSDPQILPRTRFAHWFLDSLYLTTAVAWGYAVLAVFRPVLYRFRSHPAEVARARVIVEAHGRCAMDYFKYAPDKSFLFSPSGQSVIAYRVGKNFGLALGDPVGKEEELMDLVREFLDLCRENDWGAAFYQTLPDHLPLYSKLGLRRLKIGDDAIVDLATFSLSGSAMKGVRAACNRMQKGGWAVKFHEPPIPAELLVKIRGVSDDWLLIPGRRERGFTMGHFDEDYLRGTPLYVAENHAGEVMGFVNMVPSYRAGEATNDLMRYRRDSPNGVMDFLFASVFLSCKERGFQRFNLGMAPMAGFQERENASFEERAIHQLFQYLNMLFSFSGIRGYKAKFASTWEPRYLVYRTHLELPRLLRGLQALSEIAEPRMWEKPAADES